jgi:hypothetical protein
MNRSCLETGQIDPFETGDRNPHAARTSAAPSAFPRGIAKNLGISRHIAFAASTPAIQQDQP